MSYETFEPGDTMRFTLTTSVAPNSGSVVFKVARRDPSTVTVVASITATQSDATHHFALFTMPGSDGEYRGEWFAQRTESGSAYNVVARFGFLVRESVMP